ncbi:restriction endonuclease [Vulgatibacter incomptus]|uniref:Mrr restriction system protein n=1 Tax=Vulgatibacter incomptus TaxID=1391653 RepID=A0A0K1PBL2_9BACT|nr:restriction endonuclease [Vulgatibacter incomptus]AKU90928.1 Mrr restriction system protein [Vulgatibacter incomptus]
MPVPGFQDLTLPLLQLLADGQDHLHSNVVDRLADRFDLTEAARKELLPSGRQTRFANRVGWAKTYLVKAGLVAPVSRGRYRLSEAGKQVLADTPERLDVAYLMRFPGVVEFTRGGGSPDGGAETPQPSAAAETTPEEELEASYQALRARLGAELLERVKSCTPAFFERLVVNLLVEMGYGGSRKDAGEAIGRSGDGGIDGIIKEDRLGLDAIYLQAKRWDSTVGRPTVQAFAGSLEGVRARKGVLITTSGFSKEAKEYVDRIEKRIVLIDGKELARLMMDHSVGVSEVARYAIQKIDLDFFDDEA